MTNTELTLDQLTAISGGADRHFTKLLKKIMGGSTGPFNPIDRDPGDNIGGTADPGGEGT